MIYGGNAGLYVEAYVWLRSLPSYVCGIEFENLMEKISICK
jgi:hypothetical protein